MSRSTQSVEVHKANGIRRHGREASVKTSHAHTGLTSPFEKRRSQDESTTNNEEERVFDMQRSTTLSLSVSRSFGASRDDEEQPAGNGPWPSP